MLKMQRISSLLRLNSRIFANKTKGKLNFSSDSTIKTKYDVVIVGAGHNGLVSASYLQKAGLSVAVFERRHLVGGAAVTEEIIPGFKFSRASYLLSLLRPQIFEDLELKKHGVQVYLRNPNSYTPLLEPTQARSLLLGADSSQNHQQISQFSKKDAEMFDRYEQSLQHIVDSLEPLLDTAPVNIDTWTQGSIRDKIANLAQLLTLVRAGMKLGGMTSEFYQLMTAPASKVLNQWFESEPLKATLATDSVIGAMTSPELPGSGYVLLHHVMGELEGVRGAWGYVRGGMGALSEALASCARSRGAAIFTQQGVREISTDARGQATGVVLQDGRHVEAKVVLSNATPKVTFIDLMDKKALPGDFVKKIEAIDYTSAVTKINVAVSRLPNFTADPNRVDNEPLPHHQTTIHLNCEHSGLIHDAYLDACAGRFSKRPLIEMTIPSVLDDSVAPPGAHVVQLFTQYTPYTLAGGQPWDDKTRDCYADTVFDCIEQYAPGFKASVVGRDVLTPMDLEQVFGLTGGNIFHGAMSLDQLYMSRPLATHSDGRSPVQGLYLCGSGAHPGGGVMGSPGRLAAQTVIEDLRKSGAPSWGGVMGFPGRLARLAYQRK